MSALLPGVLVGISAVVVLALGMLHLAYTFRGRKLHPVADATVEAMRGDRLRISNETTVWKAWIGFNASHSMAAILFGLVFGYLAAFQPVVLHDDWFLQAVGVSFLAGLAVLGKRYWFSIPFRGIAFAFVAFVAGVVAMRW